MGSLKHTAVPAGTPFGLTTIFDDGTVVVRSERIGCTKVGDDGLLELNRLLDASQKEWKEDVPETACERFERRLSEEIGGLRVDMARQHASVLKWMFALLIGHFVGMLSLMT